MTLTHTTPETYRVKYMALDTHTAFNVCSTKWFTSVEEIPAKYLHMIGVEYNEEDPCLYHSGVIEVRAAETTIIKMRRK